MHAAHADQRQSRTPPTCDLSLARSRLWLSPSLPPAPSDVFSRNPCVNTPPPLPFALDPKTQSPRREGGGATPHGIRRSLQRLGPLVEPNPRRRMRRHVPTESVAVETQKSDRFSFNTSCTHAREDARARARVFAGGARAAGASHNAPRGTTRRAADGAARLLRVPQGRFWHARRRPSELLAPHAERSAWPGRSPALPQGPREGPDDPCKAEPCPTGPPLGRTRESTRERLAEMIADVGHASSL